MQRRTAAPVRRAGRPPFTRPPSRRHRTALRSAARPARRPEGSSINTRLRRELGLPDAVLLGLGSIVGTGVFVSIGLAAGLAGRSTVAAVGVAAVLATANGLSSAQLAAEHPVAGGTYEYGYRFLHPLAGFLAGWSFLAAKSASAATAALAFAGYILTAASVDVRWQVPLALVAVVILTALVLSGVRRSARVNGLLVALTIGALVAFVAAVAPAAVGDPATSTVDVSLRTLAEATALMFVAYTGYGRIATLGEEVVDPRRTIPIAVVVTLVVSAVLYLSVAATATGAVDPARLVTPEARAAPLELVALDDGPAWLPGVLAAGATVAAVSVLLNLLLGLSRVALAMGRRRDLPEPVGRVDDAGRAPRVATLLVAAIVAGLALLGDVRLTWSFSAFTVLVYYGLTNAAALAVVTDPRMTPRWVSAVGLVGCLTLAFAVDPAVWAVGLGLLALGVAWWVVRRRRLADDPT